jgi:hypothetical protein
MIKIKNTLSSILFLLLSVIALSCNDIRRKKEIIRLVETWQGREIIFPQQSVFTRYAKDTVDFVIPQDVPYKVLIYVDSLGCLSCKLQMDKWMLLMEEIDTITEDEIPFLFYFHPAKVKDTKSALLRGQFDRPVCIDKEDSLNLLNGFPSNMAFQTFLLNKDNRVLVIGNPVHNAAIKGLYIQEISQNKGKESDLPPTILAVKNTEIDLGEVETETTKEIRIKLYNTGSGDFVFQGITTSCDCTEAECEQSMIPKGKSRKLTIRYKAEQAGDFMRTVSIYGNMPVSPLMLTLTGVVIEKRSKP